jgi:hypothetical protein
MKHDKQTCLLCISHVPVKYELTVTNYLISTSTLFLGRGLNIWKMSMTINVGIPANSRMDWVGTVSDVPRTMYKLVDLRRRIAILSANDLEGYLFSFAIF